MENLFGEKNESTRLPLNTEIVSAFCAFGRGLTDSVSAFPNWTVWGQECLVSCNTAERSNADRTHMSVLARRRSIVKQRSAPSSNKVRSGKSVLGRRIVQSAGLNLLCIILLHYIIFPIINWISFRLFGWSGFPSEMLYFILQISWVIPMFFITRIINLFWCQDIAQAIMIKRRPVGISSSSISYSSYVADFLLSMAVEFLFLLQTYLVGLVPLPGVSKILSCMHLALLYSMYAFEYVWVSQGVTFSVRLKMIQRSWPYFVGFGLALSLLTTWASSVFVNSCIFGFFFPILIMGSFRAKPPLVHDWMPVSVFYPSLYICHIVYCLIECLVRRRFLPLFE
ncbi:Etoposide-induced protein 2.4 -like protein [Trichinella nelsoni]|uniref:Etoposide-induced protein 2.4-like protein n=7 Tax=Trichinella TaxID=6333 RepID=A0A0V1D445_TRIBR|nr:Etoposide-induced protein 2.4 -like protein [Trichinella nelsoni]KRX46852.1 Etoposide-induced protein 2.4 -like protein [Trichinella murrelli]KRX65954.1 Etoposide-induced protein 2.4 -like protein [Trichinella sp. T9]KRY14803.1 Etoposide-induced protein 2.4 -like protein [Trichinella patagoniensis]KRY40366.1 Etoposide-induced protein 2.4 -like protein [Trichinella spiralis]KRY56198.1 Etoposide-induced protein 2.4 -like protein [Trichinella britovi]KRZ56490.1 Etoposide-induced protein 2.4 -